MVDLKTGVNPLFLTDEELRDGRELLFFAARDLGTESDGLLNKHKFGRAHHRVLFFVGRHPQCSISDLLGILRITKQSLSRVLGQLIEDGFIEQQTGQRDRRQRLLRLTPKGVEIERQLWEAQRRLMARAYRSAGADAVEGYRKVLNGILTERNRRHLDETKPSGG